MKFLMRMRTKRGGPSVSPEQMVAIFEAAKEHTNARLADGRFECAYGFLAGEGFCIANYDSHEVLMDDLLIYPQYPFMEWEITPLVDANHSYDQFIKHAKEKVG